MPVDGAWAGLGGVDTEVSFDDPLSSSAAKPTTLPNRGEDESKFEVANGARNIAPSASRSQSPAVTSFSSTARATHETSAGDMFDDEESEEEELAESRDEFDAMQTPSPQKILNKGQRIERRAFSARQPARKYDAQREEHRPTSADDGSRPSGGMSSPNAMAAAAWDVEGLEVKPQSREIDAQTRSLFGLSASALTSVSSVRAVMVRAPAMQVSPISGNDTIERTSPPRQPLLLVV